METTKPELMIRVPKLTNLEKYKDDPRPTVEISPSSSTSSSPRNISKRDRLYFKFKKNISHSISKTSLLYNIYNDLLYNIYNELVKSDIPIRAQQHFHPLHVLSDRWWNITHSYIYYYPEVYRLISKLIHFEI